MIDNSNLQDEKLYLKDIIKKINLQEFKEFAQSPETQRRLQDMNKIPRLSAMSQHNKLLSLYFLIAKGININEALYNQTFSRYVPTINEYLTTKYVDQQASEWYAHFMPWGKVMRKFFDPENCFYEIVLMGSIGCGKSEFMKHAALYNLYRVCSLRNPQMFFGSGVSKAMVLQIIAPTLKASDNLVLNPICESLKIFSNLYEEVPTEKDVNFYMGSKIAFTRTKSGIVLPHNVRIQSGSRIQHSLGQELFCGLMDEADFSIQKGAAQAAFELYDKNLKRIQSRFKNDKKNARFLFMAMSSSVTTELGTITKYASEVKENSQDTLVVNFKQWEAFQKPGEDPFANGFFFVMRGNKQFPSRVCLDEETQLIESGELQPPAACEFIKVPIMHKDKFRYNLEKNMQDILGIQTQGAAALIPSLVGCVDHIHLTPIITMEASIYSSDALWKQIPRVWYDEVNGHLQWKRYPSAVRYVANDMALVGRAAVCVLHKERARDGSVYVVVDLLLDIISKDKIDINKITQLVVDLKEMFNMNFYSVTFDQYGSQSMEAVFKQKNIAKKIHRMSAESEEIYGTLSTIIAEGHFKIGTPGLFAKQITHIQIKNGKPWIDPGMAEGHKDTADVVACATYAAILDTWAQPSNIYEDYNDYMDGKFSIKSLEYEEV